MNIVTVRINGVEYNLKGNEKEEYLHRVASYVDKKLKNIVDNNGKLSTSSAAILTAINAVDEMLKRDDEIQQLLSRMKELEQNEIQLLGDIQDFRKSISELQKNNEELKSKNERLSAENEKVKSTNEDNDYQEIIKKRDEEVEKIIKERDILQETCKKYLNENKLLKAERKEYKFQLQSSKYKVIDLQHRLIETQIELAKEKKQNNPMLKIDVL
ncbi:cell division protein ZapA [Clostridium rectalis]|uniref:cell division protein ZapA n=1 Tax=Clostridium rectalis TaxID=2040295 RepID=UPI000F641FD6|nr:cell division protein ZapA [Clostridium rectalis]